MRLAPGEFAGERGLFAKALGGRDVRAPPAAEDFGERVVTERDTRISADRAVVERRLRRAALLRRCLPPLEAASRSLESRTENEIEHKYLLRAFPPRAADVDPKRLAKARKQIAQAAAGIRARDYTARPDYLSCTYCAFRDICPASAAT